MKTCRLLPVLGLGAALSLGAAPAPEESNPRFSRIDADGDGRLTQAEFLVSVRDKRDWWSRGENAAATEQTATTPQVFLALDRNRDGYVSQEEWDQGQRLLKSRGDNNEGASRSRNKTPPGDPNRSQKAHSATQEKGAPSEANP